MAITLASLQKRIEKLQDQAAKLKAKEMKGVIQRIKVAIKHYDMQPSDLFGDAKPATAKPSKDVAVKSKAFAKKKPASEIKFRDEQGRTWTGIGRRPRWYVEATEGGKTPDDLLVKK